MLADIKVEPDGRGRSVYVVTCGRYRAVLPKCERDECQPGGHMIECRTKLNGHVSKLPPTQHPVNGKNDVNSWLRHIKTHCHGWHDGRVADFAATVAKTYGSHKPCTPGRAHALLKGRRTYAPGNGEAFVAEALGITVDEYRAELAKAAA